MQGVSDVTVPLVGQLNDQSGGAARLLDSVTKEPQFSLLRTT